MKALGSHNVHLIFPPKQVIRFEGNLYEYRGRARDRQRRHLFEADDALRIDFSDHEIMELQHKEKLEILGHAEAESARLMSEGRRPLPNFDTASSEEKVETTRLLKYIRKWETWGCPPRTEACLRPLVALVADEERDPRPPSPRNLARKIALWVESGGDVASLLPNCVNRGNRTDRIDAGQKAQFRNLIEKYYLADQPETVVGAYELAKGNWREAYRHLPEDERPEMPGLSSAYAAVREIDLYTLDYCRRGKAIAEHKFAPVDDGPVATRHNECWEMDHTVIDVIIVDEETGLPIGRPTLTIAIDRHSRAIPAFHIGWDAPGIQPVLECLKKGISLKEDLLSRVPDLRNPWPMCGQPEEIVTDNGMEFRSKAYKEILSRLGIEASRSPFKKAWYRGRIERAIKTVVHSTSHKLPGTTFSNFFNRHKERIPEKVAVCTLAELEAVIARFIVDIYHVRRHRTLNDSPMRIYNASVAANGTKPLPDPKRLAIVLSLLYYRKPQRKGILFEGLWFNSPQLVMYQTMRNVEPIVSVKVDPSDLTRVWYMDSTINNYVELTVQKSMAERVKNVTLDVHKMACAMQRSNPDVLAGEAGLSEAYTLIRRSLEERVRGRDGLANRRRAMRALAKLRKKANAMFEDASDLDGEVDTAFTEDLGDQLFGPEDAVYPLDATVAATAPAADGDVVAPAPEPLEAAAVTVAQPKKRGRPPGKSVPKLGVPATRSSAKVELTDFDEMGDLDAAMGSDLFVNPRKEASDD